MFKSELNGYNREEVDSYITKLKAELMEQDFIEHSKDSALGKEV